MQSNQRHTELLVIIHANHLLCSTAVPQSPRRDSSGKKTGGSNHSRNGGSNVSEIFTKDGKGFRNSTRCKRALTGIAEALEVRIAEFFSEEEPADINSYDKSEVEKLRLLNQLDESEKKSIFNIIDIALTKKRLKDTLSNALNGAL